MDSSERCSTTMALFHMSTQFNILFQCLYAFPSLLFGKNPLTADHESLYLLPSIYQKHKCSRYSKALRYTASRSADLGDTRSTIWLLSFMKLGGMCLEFFFQKNQNCHVQMASFLHELILNVPSSKCLV